MKCTIKKSGSEICSAELANTFIKRALGLMLRKSLGENEGMLIEFSKSISSRSIHSFFMRFPIELIFINESNKIAEIAQLKPWSYYSPNEKANLKYVLEVNPNFSSKHDIKAGDALEIEFDY